MQGQAKKLLLLVSFFSFVVCFLFGESIQHPANDRIVISTYEMIDHDYFAYSRYVEISGTVKGDVYLFGGEVIINDTIEGNLFVFSGTVRVNGHINRDAYLFGGEIIISGEIKGNVTALAGRIELAPSAKIGKNAFLLAGHVNLEGLIWGSVHIYASYLHFSGRVNQDMLAHVGAMYVERKAWIGGMLNYWSGEKAFISPEAQVIGEVTYHPSFIFSLLHGKFLKHFKIGSKLVTLMMNFLYTFVIALILMRYFPERITRSTEALRSKPFQVLVAGMTLVILLPLIFLLLLITILGIPFALTLLAVNVIGFYTAKILTILWLTDDLVRRFHIKPRPRLYFFCMLMIYYAVSEIPYIGLVIAFIALLFGLGSLVIGRSSSKKKHLFQRKWLSPQIGKGSPSL